MSRQGILGPAKFGMSPFVFVIVIIAFFTPADKARAG
jgi:hypothetical protein